MFESKVRDALMKQVVPLVFEPRDGKTTPYIYTGFLVALGNNWFWITAAHVGQNIEQAKKAYPGAGMALVPMCGEEGHRILLSPEKLKFVDFQRSLSLLRRAKPELGVTERDIELFDFAMFPVPDITQCYLLSQGVSPFTEEQTTVDLDWLANQLRGNENWLFVGGVPELSHEAHPDRQTMEFTFKVFPLHPWPDGEDAKTSNRVISAEGQFTWIPTGWDREDWDGHTCGVSGGPVVVQTGEHLILLGVQTHQKPKQVNPEYIGFCNSSAFIQAIKDALVDQATAVHDVPPEIAVHS